MTAVKLHFILYTKQVFPASCYCNVLHNVTYYLYKKQFFPATCNCNDRCKVEFYPLYKAAISRYMLLKWQMYSCILSYIQISSSPLNVTVMTRVLYILSFIQSRCSHLHVTLMTAVQLHFILYTKHLFPATCYYNDSCTVEFYPLYKTAFPRYMLL